MPDAGRINRGAAHLASRISHLASRAESCRNVPNTSGRACGGRGEKPCGGKHDGQRPRANVA
ncbi:hypothetical protein A8H36_30625 [Burkholderia thailandensis]|nr:hypothetical protein A8H36_30625 [Burkholderia thailandensis]NOK42546.1 hypothetical protein [Burkholderia thailandensis]NOK55979.1 hypothetical protein [Burkholderia thailandensis]